MRAILDHERPSIVDVLHGAEPLGDFSRGPVLAVNGEIYNHRELRARLSNHPFPTAADRYLVARDPLGVIPLYTAATHTATSTWRRR